VVSKEVTVSLKLFGDGFNVVIRHFSEFERVSSNYVTSDILFKESDDIKGFSILLDGSNEKLIAIALIIKEDFALSGDLVLSQLVPSNIIFGFSQLLLEVSSILLSLSPKFLVKVHHFGEFSDSGSSDLFVSCVLLVRCILSVNVLLLKVT
jgi:hypothetical protein